MTVENMVGTRGNRISNQFILKDEKHDLVTFQSYKKKYSLRVRWVLEKSYILYSLLYVFTSNKKNKKIQKIYWQSSLKGVYYNQFKKNKTTTYRR